MWHALTDHTPENAASPGCPPGCRGSLGQDAAPYRRAEELTVVTFISAWPLRKRLTPALTQCALRKDLGLHIFTWKTAWEQGKELSPLNHASFLRHLFSLKENLFIWKAREQGRWQTRTKNRFPFRWFTPPMSTQAKARTWVRTESRAGPPIQTLHSGMQAFMQCQPLRQVFMPGDYL